MELPPETKKVPRKRIKAVCRRGSVIHLPCSWLSKRQLIDGTGICSADGLKCVIVREVR